MPATKQRVFVIRPFGTKQDSKGGTINFERIHSELIAPALAQAGLEGGTTGQIVDAGNIREDMFALIIEADVIVCDVTLHNANVFYELGIRHALRKKRSILIKGSPVADPTPFDILTDRYVPYLVTDPAKACADLTATINATLASDRETDSPVFKMLPRLPELDPGKVQTLPTDFAEEVARARAAGSPGWLRLLASEVVGLRFQWPALRVLGQAQLDLKDLEGARRTWERIRDNDPNDLGANIALSNIYERLFRKENKPELLAASDLAIARVQDSNPVSVGQQAELAGLKARNLKSRWRLQFSMIPDATKRRGDATNRALLDTYEAYRRAFLIDLNNFWPGLAALQQGTIATDLASGSAWEDLFESASEAEAYKSNLTRQLERLRPCVSESIAAIAERRATSDEDRIWAAIAKADMLFLSEQNEARVIKAYRDAVPADSFFWNAAKGQLELFASVGFRQNLVTRIIEDISARIDPKPTSNPAMDLIIFAGHRIDEPERATARFPADREGRVRDLIAEALTAARGGSQPLMVMASASPGSDIICHEVCRDLGIESTICLPMPHEEVARQVFGSLFSWRSRYLELIRRLDQKPGALLELSDRSGLPRWLSGRDIDPWERGNRWVLEMAQTYGAAKVMLIALWDGKPVGDGRGGTGNMVQIAQEAGTIDINIIDAAQLLH